jgi:hypothetical protein
VYLVWEIDKCALVNDHEGRGGEVFNRVVW